MSEAPPAAARTSLVDNYSFHACTGEIDGDSQTLTCPEFVISRTVVVVDGSWTSDLMLKMTLATLREGAETVGATSDRRVDPNLSVDGGRGFAMTLSTVDDIGERTMGMTTFARPLDDDTVVGVMCVDLETVDPARCEELSVWFAVTIPEVTWVDVTQPTRFAGRMLNAPPGCALDGDNIIICAGTGSEIIWFERAAEDAADSHMAELQVVHDAIVRMNEERTGHKAPVTDEAFGCRLDGELAECRLYKYDFGVNSLYVLVGAGHVRATDVAVLCDWTSDVTDEVPIPCSLVVDPTLAAPTKEL